MADYSKIPLVFNTYKPVGMSSFDVVHHFKKNLNYDFGKIGHFGTLDPFAEGVLLVGVQGAQKLNDYVHKLLPKTYRAKGIFGVKTKTGDLTVSSEESRDIEDKWKTSSLESLQEVLGKKFLGEYWQRPHSVSATKFEGKRLYQHAMAGRMIQKEKVKREIYTFEILSFNYPVMDFIVSVSSGTYVRSLFEEMAQELGGFGALQTLERLAIGPLGVDQSIHQKEWPSKNESLFSLEKWGKPIDQVLELNHVILKLEQTKRYLKGQRLRLEDIVMNQSQEVICSENYFWIYNEDGTLLGLGRPEGTSLHAIFNLALSIALFS